MLSGYWFLFDFRTRTIPTGLNTTSKGTDIMKIISDYVEKHDVMWKKLRGFSADGVPVMLGDQDRA